MERLDKLIEAAFFINRETSDTEDLSETDMDDRIIPEFQALYKKIKNWHSFSSKLSHYEWINPRLAIKVFFEFQPISHRKDKLHEFLQVAIKDESICSVIPDRSALYMDCEHLNRLIEAMWLIKLSEG